VTVIDLDERRTLIGGSDAAAACGVDPFRSRVALFAEKISSREREESEPILWGKRLEPVIADVLAQTGRVILPAPEEGFRDGERPWMVAHPDGFTEKNGERGIVEIKTAGHWTAPQWQDGDTPTGYMVQVHHNMAVTGDQWALLACLLAGQQLVIREVQRDETIVALVLELEDRFMGYLRRREWPPPDGSQSAAEAIRAAFPAGVAGMSVRLDRDAMALVDELRARAAQLAAVKVQHDALKQALQVAMGDAEVALGPNDEVVAKWTSYSRRTLDAKALRQALPSIAEEYTVETPTRRFTVE
jgi:putative phage-type endonuclease